MLTWPSSIRVRLTLWYAILLGLPLAIFAIVSYVAFSRALVSSTDRFVGEALGAFTRELGAERRAGLPVRQAMQATVAEVRFRELHILITDSTGQLVARGDFTSDSTVGVPDESVLQFARTAAGTESQTMRLRVADGEHLLRVQPLMIDGQRYLLSGQYPLREAGRMMAGIRRMFLIAIPLLIVVAAISGYFLADRSLKPVTSMTSTSF